MDLSEIKQDLATYKTDFERDPRWLTTQTDHYIFHYFPKSVAEKEINTIAQRQEDGLKRIVEFLEIPKPTQKITYYFYPNGKTKEKLMGDDWYAQAIIKDFVVHVLYTEQDKPIGEHEDTHLLSLSWGMSIAFFQEGLAEYLVGHSWHGESHDELAREALEKKILPSVEEMMGHEKWMTLPDKNAQLNYCFAGSFTKFLIETYGKEKFKRLYKDTNRNKTRAENTKIFEEVYGLSPNKAEEGWKFALQSKLL